jgi:hypothetical protein
MILATRNTSRIRRNLSRGSAGLAVARRDIGLAGGQMGESVANPSRLPVTDFGGRKALFYKEKNTLSLSLYKSVTPTPARCLRARARGVGRIRGDEFPPLRCQVMTGDDKGGSSVPGGDGKGRGNSRGLRHSLFWRAKKTLGGRTGRDLGRDRTHLRPWPPARDTGEPGPHGAALGKVRTLVLDVTGDARGLVWLRAAWPGKARLHTAGFGGAWQGKAGKSSSK